MISSLEELARSKGGPASILLVDDDQATLELFRALSDGYNCEWEMLPSGKMAVDKVRERPFDLVMLDLKMPGNGGEVTFTKIKLVRPRQPVVIISGYLDSEVILRLQKIGFCALIQKPTLYTPEFFQDMLGTFQIRKRQ